MTEGPRDESDIVVRRKTRPGTDRSSTDRSSRDRSGDARSTEGPSLRIGRGIWSVGALAFALRAIWVFVFASVPGGSLLSDPILITPTGCA
ncbi:MAG: hypothetical protein R2789_10390 [Microthrixaceae bacterium]